MWKSLNVSRGGSLVNRNCGFTSQSQNDDSTVLSVVCLKEINLDFWLRFIFENTLPAQPQNCGLRVVKKKTGKSLLTGTNNHNDLTGGAKQIRPDRLSVIPANFC